MRDACDPLLGPNARQNYLSTIRDGDYGKSIGPGARNRPRRRAGYGFATDSQGRRPVSPQAYSHRQQKRGETAPTGRIKPDRHGSRSPPLRHARHHRMVQRGMDLQPLRPYRPKVIDTRIRPTWGDYESRGVAETPREGAPGADIRRQKEDSDPRDRDRCHGRLHRVAYVRHRTAPPNISNAPRTSVACDGGFTQAAYGSRRRKSVEHKSESESWAPLRAAFQRCATWLSIGPSATIASEVIAFPTAAG